MQSFKHKPNPPLPKVTQSFKQETNKPNRTKLINLCLTLMTTTDTFAAHCSKLVGEMNTSVRCDMGSSRTSQFWQ